MFHGPNGQFQHGCNVPWSQFSVLAWLDCAMVKIVNFRMITKSHKKPKKVNGTKKKIGR
jgi:hypothetical protein